MIRRVDGADWLLILQPDHAAACGLMAEWWGSAGGVFAPPDPSDAVALAAREHDNGWAEWDAAPTVDRQTGRPRNFTEMPIPEYLPIWRRGIRRTTDRDRYAGLLVSLHGAYLLRHRRARGTDPPEDQEALEGFLKEQAMLQEQTQQMLGQHRDAVPRNFRLLQVWDRLSLLLCCGPIPSTTLDRVPARDGTLDIAVLPDSERSAALRPYPFGRSPLEFTVPARRLPARAFATPEILRSALALAPTETLRLTLHAA